MAEYKFKRYPKMITFTPKAVGPKANVKKLARRNPKKKTA